MAQPEPTTYGPAAWVRAALPLPHLGRPPLPGAAVLALVLVGLAVGLNLGVKGQALLGGAGLLVWGHGAVWLVTGEVQRLDAGLTDLAGATWWVFLATWWIPLSAGWIVAGALL